MKHTILFLAANPRDSQQLALQEECAAIQRELCMTPGRGCFDFQSRWAVGVDELLRHLNELAPAIIHFSGHGTSELQDAGGVGDRDASSPRPAGLLLQAEDRSQFVSERALAAMIASASPSTRLVVLNACHSAAMVDTLRGTVACVVGVEGSIADSAARSFAVAFYRALGYRQSVGNAVAQATAALDAKEQRHSLVVCATRDGVSKDELVLAGLPAPPGGPDHEVPPTCEGYELVLTHPAANRASAFALHELLSPRVRVFLAARSVPADDRRDLAARAARAGARATALIVSRQADAAWYLGDDVLAAIARQRASPDAERIFLVLLEPGIRLPHLLSGAPTISAMATGGMTGVAAQLEGSVEALRRTAHRVQPENHDPAPSSTAPVSHFRLYDRLRQLARPTFEQIAASAGSAWNARPLTTMSDRVLDLAQLAALDPGLSRRLSRELDRRAPWTRR